MRIRVLTLIKSYSARIYQFILSIIYYDNFAIKIDGIIIYKPAWCVRYIIYGVIWSIYAYNFQQSDRSHYIILYNTKQLTDHSNYVLILILLLYKYLYYNLTICNIMTRVRYTPFIMSYCTSVPSAIITSPTRVNSSIELSKQGTILVNYTYFVNDKSLNMTKINFKRRPSSASLYFKNIIY